MKSLIVASVFIISSASFACTNFSGTYYYQDINKATEVVQTGCEKISMVTPELTITVATDNIFHEVANEDIILEGQNMGKLIVNARANFGAKELFLDLNMHIEMMGQTKDVSSTSISTLLANGDIQSVTIQEGQTVTTIGKKIK